MIESIMYFGIGFLVAGLIGLVLLPLFTSRAARLTAKRFEAATPVSMSEIQADKDQLRAEFAMSTRRLELSVEQLKARTTGQLSELGKKTEAITRLKADLGEKTAAIFALEAREKALRDQIRAGEEELAVKTNTMHETARALSDKEAELAKLSAELGDQSSLSESQRVEIVALRTQVEALRGQIDRFEADVKDAEDRLTRVRGEAESATRELKTEREKSSGLSQRVDALERQLVAQTTEAELLSRRVQDLEARLNEQGRLLAERDYEASSLRTELENARRVEQDLRSELAALDTRHRTANADLRADKAVVESELAHMREERDKLRNELAGLKHEAETTWAAERVENALLRERINDIATDVARLTLALEGPGSPIETLLAEAEKKSAAGRAGGAETHPGNLADRIRALQLRASSAAPATAPATAP
jgi:chromosome segregation ATPase